MPVELTGPERDGSSQAGRARPELDPGYVRLDERGPADLVAFVRSYARQLLWYGADGVPAGDWTPMFAALGAGLTAADAAAFAADPAAFADDRYAPLRKPHLMLLLACIRLMRHGQDAINAIADRHYDWQLREVLRLAPAPATPQRAFVLFDLAAGVAAAEAPVGLRLLAGRDAQRRDRVFRLEEGLVVNRARVAALATSFVDRDAVTLEQARAAEGGTDEDKTLALLRVAYGDPAPGDAMPPLRGATLSAARLSALRVLLAFGPDTLRLRPFELRALVERKRRRDGDGPDWQLIDAVLQAGGQAVRGDDPSWTLSPADPRDFDANLRTAYRGDPMVDNGLEDVATIDDLLLRLEHPDGADEEAAVRGFVEQRLRLDVDGAFVPMMQRKRASDADWQVVNGYLQQAGRAARGDPAWLLAPAKPHAFDDNLAAALGHVDWSAAGDEGAGVGDVGGYLDRVVGVEDWFFLTAEQLAALLPVLAPFEGETAGGGAGWTPAYALLAQAYARRVRDGERRAIQAIREHAPDGAGMTAALAEAVGRVADPAALLDTLAHYAAPADVELVRAAQSGAGPAAGDAAGWKAIDAVLAEARRRRLSLPEPVPVRRHWRTLWAEADPAAAAGAQPWPAFGQVPADAGPGRAPATLGWAIASPALALSGGRRSLTLTLGLAIDAAALPALVDAVAGTPAPLAVSISTGGDWWTPATVALATADYAGAFPAAGPPDATPGRAWIAVRADTLLAPGDPTPAPPAAGPGDGRWPVLRLTLAPTSDPAQRRFDSAYERFRGVTLHQVRLAVATGGPDDGDGLWPLELETDAGPVGGRKPFEPFGAAAPVGAELAIAHRDLLAKRLTAITVALRWQGAPPDLTTGYYANYVPAARAFAARFRLVDRRVVASALGPTQPLFAADPAAPRSIGLDVAAAAPADGAADDPGARTARDRRRYLVMEFAGPGFGHAEYPAVAAGRAIDLATALRGVSQTGGAAPKAADYVVNPPYTPRLKRLELQFAAVHEVDVARYRRDGAIDRMFHLHPFGAVEAPDAPADGWPLLPAYDEQGALYVGLDGVVDGQTLALLIETVDRVGSDTRPQGLAWSYLDAGGWTAFAEPPRDTSLGLERPGIVGFVLPAAAPDARMPVGRYWLRATLADGAEAAAPIAGIHAQAASAVYVVDGAAAPAPAPADTAPDAATPLPAGSIRTIADPAPGLLRVAQPYPGFGGTPAEGDAAFRTRAGERLRHKGRALTAWDYEHLVLARFPQVHKAKCLPASGDDTPGRVRVVIVPDIRGGGWAEPFAPRAPVRLLDEVRTYLQPLAPAAASVTTVNPSFVRVRVRVAVRFAAAGDEAFDKRRLADALDRYLAPWAFDEGAEIAIGQRIDATALVAFIDALPFVDFVGGCRLFQSDDGGASYTPGVNGGDAVVAARADAILTPSTDHEIDVIADDVFAQERFAGIGYMKIELDFVVGG